MEEHKTNRTPVDELEHYLNARRPVVFIRNVDYSDVDRIVRETVERLKKSGEKWRVEEYSESGDRIDWKLKNGPIPDNNKNYSLARLLESYDDSKYGDPNQDESEYRWLLLLKGVAWRSDCGSSDENNLFDHRVSGRIQSIALRLRMADENPKTNRADRKYGVHIVIAGEEVNLTPELEKWTSVVDVPPPNDKQLESIIRQFQTTNNVTIRSNYLPQLKMDLSGLSEFEALQLLNLASVLGGGVISKNIRTVILEEKRQAVKKSGLLDLQEPEDDEVGGLENLQQYFETVKPIFKNPPLAEKHHVSKPAGVMIVGMPGCGKSLSAKFIARKLNLSLLRLDVGRLMGKYVGESEGQFRRAIQIAESAAPCVLWIDEIEKAFAGIGESGGGGEVTTRMFGAFLTWMQEKKSSVYVVATANDISNLPPEFQRRGRFDEIFSVGYPNKTELADIFRIHLKKKKHSIPERDIKHLVETLDDSKHYSGADVASIVNEVTKNLFAHNLKQHGENEEEWEDLTPEHLANVIKDFKSSYQSQRKKLEEMAKKLKELDVKPASGSFS